MVFAVSHQLYLIEILHQTTTERADRSLPLRCILSKFYIKPQLYAQEQENTNGCILSKFYIKPQPREVASLHEARCILSKFYIKPQPATNNVSFRRVVSYRNSTSNHNCESRYRNNRGLYLIEILHQTTTRPWENIEYPRLYLIEILHQTTTIVARRGSSSLLYLIEILHQTTTCVHFAHVFHGCILSKFYIKPQLLIALPSRTAGCILSKFYIKPQLFPIVLLAQ